MDNIDKFFNILIIIINKLIKVLFYFRKLQSNQNLDLILSTKKYKY